MRMASNTWAMPDNDPVMKESYEATNINKTMALMTNQTKAVALDLGAHIGVWSKKLSKFFGQVHSFEPVPRHLECFEHNLKGINNVKLHKVALGNHIHSEQPMKICLYNGGRSSMEQRRLNRKITDRERMITVPITRLDMYYETGVFTDVNFIKIDVEGYEIKLLQGAEKILTECNPTIYMEDFARANGNTWNAGQYLIDNFNFRQIATMPGHLGPTKHPNFVFRKEQQ